MSKEHDHLSGCDRTLLVGSASHLSCSGGPSGSGKTSLARKMANIVGCEVVFLESYYKSEQVKDFKYDDFSSLDVALLSKNIDDIRNCRRTKVPVFDLENGARSGFKELEVSEDCGVVIFEGVYALHPYIRKSLDLWIAVVGGVHSHLISRVQRDKSRVGCFMSQNEIMTTVFPMFQQHIEPHLVHAHLKIRNDFDPVLSPESSLFMLKSNKQVAYQDILKILDPAKICSSVQNFIDIYLRLPGIPANGQLTESDCIRVRICEGRFALLIREPIREGNFIIQPKVDFDISINTVAGLLNLGCGSEVHYGIHGLLWQGGSGYQAVAYIEASAYIYQDGKFKRQYVKGPYKTTVKARTEECGGSWDVNTELECFGIVDDCGRVPPRPSKTVSHYGSMSRKRGAVYKREEHENSCGDILPSMSSLLKCGSCHLVVGSSHVSYSEGIYAPCSLMC
ncbi:unnamed protein product [Ilex paraguariensis]|uniref:Phosphoribulokinase/uridine kinase domain-containing protein n=1 Tax=Ilex paraguariensis TaxID=185542 RepID=A0ABC8SRK5_9AQUA